MSKHEAMERFVKEKVEDLSFNFSPDRPASISFLTNYSGKVAKRYVRAADKEYGFTILLTWHYSTEADDMNLQAMEIAQEFMDWIDAQDRKRNFPDFGDGCQVKKLENLQNMPNLVMVDMENGIAQYQIPCRVLYFEKER